MLPKRVGGLATVSVRQSMSVLNVSNEAFDRCFASTAVPNVRSLCVCQAWLTGLGIPDCCFFRSARFQSAPFLVDVSSRVWNAHSNVACFLFKGPTSLDSFTTSMATRLPVDKRCPLY